jgi:hypothetical protein
MEALREFVDVAQDGVTLSDAEVLVNGQSIPPSSGLEGSYYGTLASPAAPGQPVALEVRWNGLTVTGSATMPTAPQVTAPAEADVVSAGATLEVAWNCAVEPDRFVVVASWWCPTACLEVVAFDAPGTARALTIPGGKLPAGQQVGISVHAFNNGLLEGDYTPWPVGPGMNVQASSTRIMITTE